MRVHHRSGRPWAPSRLARSAARRIAAAALAAGMVAVVVAVVAAAVVAGASAQQPGAGAKPKPAEPATKPGEPATVIVFDGSGSMWGRLEGDNRTNKLTVAREALRLPLAKAGPKTRVGLVSFGHRRKGDCSDVELIAAPEIGPAERIMEPLDKLNPRGKGPVANALREAAKAVAGAKPASIVLVNDNADNCQQDACAVAEEIAKAHPGIAIHAIGIALEPDEVKRMACVARGAGKFVNAEDAGKLTAAIGEAMQVALKSPDAAPAAAQAGGQPAAKDGVAAKPPASPQGAPGVSSLGVSARLGANGPAVELPLSWRVTRSGETTPVIETEAREVLKPLPAGRYDVEARIGLVSARQTVTVPEQAPASVVIPLEAGHVRYVLQNGKSADGVAGVVVSLLPAAADGKDGAAAPLRLSRDTAGDLYLPPGNYVLAVDQGAVHREVKLAVAAGSSRVEDVQLGTGRLTVFAQAQEGGPALDGALFVVAADDPDAPQGVREVARSGASQPQFVLPTGTYQVTARLGTSEVRQRVAVGAGESVKAGIVLGLGKVQVTHALDAMASKSGVPVLTRVSRLDTGGAPAIVARFTGANPTFSLPSGRYRVESAVGEQNARVAADVDLKPGTVVTVAMRIDTGQLALKPAGLVLPAAGDTLWEIRDAKGQIVWRTIQPDPRAMLLPGRYVVRAETRGRSSEQTVDVAAGETRTVGAQP